MGSQIGRRKRRSGFATAVGTLAGATALGQGIGVLASPVLSRLYSPEDFGLLSVFAAILGLVGSIAGLRYNLAIPLPEKDEDGVALTVLTVLSAFVVSVILTLVTLPYRAEIAVLVNVPILTDYFWMLPVSLALVGLYTALSGYGLRVGIYGTIARTRVTQSLTMTVVQIIGAGFGPVALLAGRVLGQAAGIGTLAVALLRRDGAHLRRLRVAGVTRNAAEYRKFPLVSVWVGLFSSLGSSLPPLLIAGFFGASAAGLFGLSYRVLITPITVVGKAVGDVFYRQAARTVCIEGGLRRLVKGVHVQMVAIAMPPFLFLLMVAPRGFGIIFGEEWVLSGTLGSIMVPWMFLQFTTTPATRIFPIIDRHDLALRFQMLLAASAAISISLGGTIAGLTFAVGLLSALHSLVYLARLGAVYRLTGSTLGEALCTLLRFVPISILAVSPLLAVLTIEMTQGGRWPEAWLGAAALSGVLAAVASAYGFIRARRRSR